jgi:class 3 adenylate cyclase/CHASE2 domain-containing sensor protein
VTSRQFTLWRRYRRAIVTIVLGGLGAAVGLLAGSGIGLVDGLGYDLSLALTDSRPGSRDEPVAIIALDRDSLDSDELAAMPRVFLSPIWAKLVSGLTKADARAIGFDIIFSYSANRFPGFAGQYDHDFLAVLATARDRIVLARSAGSYPAPPFVAAVFDPVADAGKGEPGAIAYAELSPDSDGVYRRLTPGVETAGGRTLPTFAAALLGRAKGPEMPPEVLLAPRQPLEAIPAYRLIDVLHCLDRDPEVIRQAFSGKVVLIGTNLPEEDRKSTPDRFMRPRGPREASDGSCQLDRLGASDPDSRTSPGVFVHAAVVETVLTGNLITPVAPAGRAIAAGITAVGGALLGFWLPPSLAILGVALLVAVCLAAAPILLGVGLWFAAVLPGGAGIAAMVVAYIVRFLIEERRRRRVQNALGHYLAPAVVDQLVDSEAPLHLGGEERQVTIMFADLSGFTALSGKVGPAELMAVTNSYLAILVEAVEATGGYVDKFIGDAVMGIWGAPASNPDHATAAARAALAAVAEVMRAKAEADARHEPGYAVKIGLNSGRAVVGNVGAEKRYNYTAVGETVNIASRLESVPGDYGCRVVVGPATAAAIEDCFVLNELDWVKVKGKDEPMAVYELVAEKDSAEPGVLAYPAQYHAALERYRDGQFSEAEEFWRCHVAHPYLVGTSPPLVMAERAAALRADPPGDWDGIFVKTTK